MQKIYFKAKQSLVSLIIISFLLNTFGPIPAYSADGPATFSPSEFRLPAPGVMVSLSPVFEPPILKGIKVYSDKPFRFDFILDKGDPSFQAQDLKKESVKLIKYFLASLTIPEKDLWVNLSPYEKDRIIPHGFGLTEMGRDLLAEDYMLKQITASLIYPEGETGRKFWKRIYKQAARKFGTTNIPVNTFNKVWIVPEKAEVYENAKTGTAYVVESKLKVMLEQDYLSMQKHSFTIDHAAPPAASKQLGLLGADIIREIVIPELTREVNEDKNFAQLRQVYNSLILATWYKKKIKDSILEQVYADKNKIAGVGYNSSLKIEFIYQRYLQAFKKGVYNFIKEEQDPLTQEMIPRKYFSGGVNETNLVTVLKTVSRSRAAVSINALSNSNRAMLIASSVQTSDHAIKDFNSFVDVTGDDKVSLYAHPAQWKARKGNPAMRVHELFTSLHLSVEQFDPMSSRYVPEPFASQSMEQFSVTQGDIINYLQLHLVDPQLEKIRNSPRYDIHLYLDTVRKAYLRYMGEGVPEVKFKEHQKILGELNRDLEGLTKEAARNRHIISISGINPVFWVHLDPQDIDINGNMTEIGKAKQKLIEGSMEKDLQSMLEKTQRMYAEHFKTFFYTSPQAVVRVLRHLDNPVGNEILLIRKEMDGKKARSIILENARSEGQPEAGVIERKDRLTAILNANLLNLSSALQMGERLDWATEKDRLLKSARLLLAAKFLLDNPHSARDQAMKVEELVRRINVLVRGLRDSSKAGTKRQELRLLLSQASQVTTGTYDQLTQVYTAKSGETPEGDDLKSLKLFISMVRGFDRSVPAHVLDVGTGLRDMRWFSQQGQVDSTGVDNSKSVIDLIKTQLGETPNAKVAVMDMNSLKFPDHTFDGVRAWASLHHLPLIDQFDGVDIALREFNRVLKIGGICSVKVKAETADRKGFMALDTQEGLGKRLYQFFSRNDLIEVFRRNGFEIRKEDIREVTDNRGEKNWVVFAKKINEVDHAMSPVQSKINGQLLRIRDLLHGRLDLAGITELRYVLPSVELSESKISIDELRRHIIQSIEDQRKRLLQDQVSPVELDALEHGTVARFRQFVSVIRSMDLSPEIEDFLLRTDVFSVLLGIKPAFVASLTGKGVPKFVQSPQFNDALARVSGSLRVSAAGHYIVIYDKTMIEGAIQKANSSSIANISFLKESALSTDDLVRKIFSENDLRQGALLGYSLDDVAQNISKNNHWYPGLYIDVRSKIIPEYNIIWKSLGSPEAKRTAGKLQFAVLISDRLLLDQAMNTSLKSRDSSQLTGMIGMRDGWPAAVLARSEILARQADQIKERSSSPLLNYPKAGFVPWKEVVSDPKQSLEEENVYILSNFGPRENRISLWANNQDARTDFLKLVNDVDTGDFQENAQAHIIDRIAQIHKVLLTGSSGQSFYLSRMFFRSLDKNKQDQLNRAYRVAGRIIHRQSLSVESRSQRIFASFKSVLDEIHHSDERPAEEFVKALAGFYIEMIRGQKQQEEFLFVYGNDSLAMNMVNGFLRLSGLNGISHGHLESIARLSPEKETLDVLKSMIGESNKGIDFSVPIQEHNAVIASQMGAVPVSKGLAMTDTDVLRGNETIAENKKYVTLPDKIVLPHLIQLGDGYSLRLGKTEISPSDQMQRFGAITKVVYDYYNKDSKYIGWLPLRWDDNTYSWRPYYGITHAIYVPAERGKGLGTRAYRELVKIFGVLGSSDTNPERISSDIIAMWNRLNAKTVYIGNNDDQSTTGYMFVIRKDNAMAHTLTINNGGIDFKTDHLPLKIRTGGLTDVSGDGKEGIKFHLDPAVLEKLQNAPGFVPVIINIKPLSDLDSFLGMDSKV